MQLDSHAPAKAPAARRFTRRGTVRSGVAVPVASSAGVKVPMPLPTVRRVIAGSRTRRHSKRFNDLIRKSAKMRGQKPEQSPVARKREKPPSRRAVGASQTRRKAGRTASHRADAINDEVLGWSGTVDDLPYGAPSTLSPKAQLAYENKDYQAFWSEADMLAQRQSEIDAQILSRAQQQKRSVKPRSFLLSRDRRILNTDGAHR